MPGNPLIRVWFGPPGVGKSTHIRQFGGLDLEHLPTTELRHDYVRALTYRLGQGKASTVADIAAADLQPRDFNPRYFQRILVLPPLDVYRSRRATRDQQHPHKAQQPDVYSGFASDKSSFDTVLVDFPQGK